MALIQGRHAYLMVGNDTIPVYNYQIASPRNIVVGQPLGNTWATNFAYGLQTTRVTMSLMPRVNTGEALTFAFWNLFFQRTWGNGLDDTTAVDLAVFTGRRRYFLPGAKAESFTLTIQKGAPVGFNCVFVAPTVPTITNSVVNSYASTVDSAPPLMFDRVLLGGFNTNVYGIEITYANNHIPDAPLNGTIYADSYDAGPITATIAVTVAEKTGASQIDGITNATITLQGQISRTLTLGQIVINNPRDVNAQLGPIFHTYNGFILGTQTSPPVTLS